MSDRTRKDRDGKRRRFVRRTLRAVNRLLKGEHRTPDLGNKSDPLDELIFICLTQRTHEAGFTRSYNALRKRFPTWERMARAREYTIAKTITNGGLVGIKAKRIKRILRSVDEHVGKYDLSVLHTLSDGEAFHFLTRKLGTGTKTAYCVMLYSLRRDVFPIDANCLRIFQRLGVLPGGIRSYEAHQLLEGMVPNGVAYDLHVNMVVHGRTVCRRRPKCLDCVIATLCDYAQAAPALEGTLCN